MEIRWKWIRHLKSGKQKQDANKRCCSFAWTVVRLSFFFRLPLKIIITAEQDRNRYRTELTTPDKRKKLSIPLYCILKYLSVPPYESPFRIICFLWAQSESRWFTIPLISRQDGGWKTSQLPHVLLILMPICRKPAAWSRKKPLQARAKLPTMLACILLINKIGFRDSRCRVNMHIGEGDAD